MLTDLDKTKCTGCSACYSACPTNSIVMEKDEEGFLYPRVLDSCGKCGKCERICPSLNKVVSVPTVTQKAYCVLSKSKRVWKKSASGGAFSEICNAYGDANTMISGAVFNGFNVEHVVVKGVENIAPLRKSKYVASNVNDCYKIIKEALLDGKKAIFCGTPCQVAGLKAFLGKDYENLLLIDLICHGEGSPKVFTDCIDIAEKDFNAKVVEYEFRAKRIMYETPYLVKLSFSNNKKLYVVDERYMQLFLNQDCLRPSCAQNCIYRTSNRKGDLTIADCKNVQSIFPELIGSNYNYSTVVTNTKKGEVVLENMKKYAIIKEYDIEHVKKYNPLFFRQTGKASNREVFFNDYKTLGGENTILKYTTSPVVKKINKKQVIARAILKLCPKKIKKRFLKTFKK